jgi:hypothetical protein
VKLVHDEKVRQLDGQVLGQLGRYQLGANLRRAQRVSAPRAAFKP